MAEASKLPPDFDEGFASFDSKGIAVDLTYKVTFTKMPNPSSPDQLAKLRAQMEARKTDPIIIEGVLESFSETKVKTRVKIVQVIAKDGVMKCVLLDKPGGKPKAIEYVNGDLVCTALNPDGTKWEYSIERSSFFASPHTMGQRFLPWYLGIFSLDRLFEGEGTVVDSPSGTTVSRKFQWEPRRSVFLDAKKDEGQDTFRFELTYGRKEFGANHFCELSNWKVIDGHRLPGLVKERTLQAQTGKLDRTMTAELISAKFEDVKTDDLKTLGPIGQEVTDCRFGSDACVRYKIKDRLLTDAEVQALLDIKDGKEQPKPLDLNPAPEPPTPPSTFMFYGFGAIGLGSLLALALKKIAFK